jgi:hypothetical protein
MMPPAAERDGNHAPDSAIEGDERCEGVFCNPVDRKLGTMLMDVADQCERVDDVAQRRRTHDKPSSLAWHAPWAQNRKMRAVLAERRP